ncbi:hypothetical protein ACTXT7_011769 [Hymenolepis weldensis]
MVTCLPTNANRSSLDELAESADIIQEFSDWPCVYAPDVLTKLLEKLDLLVLNISSQPGNKQHSRLPKQSRCMEINTKKCQPGCKYPKTDTITSQGNFTGSNVSVIPRSAEKCFLQPTDLALQATSSHFFNPHMSLYAIWTSLNQNLKVTECLGLNCNQPSRTTNSATEIDLFQTDIQELSQELPEHADDSIAVQHDIHGFLPEHATTSSKTRDKRKKKIPKSTAVNQLKPSQSVTQHRSPKHRLLLLRVTRRQHYLKHTNPLLVCKPHNFTRKSSLRGSILQKRSPSLIISQNPAWSRCRKKGLQKHENLNPKIKQPNRHQLLSQTLILTCAQSSSKDTVQPSTLQDTVKSATPPSCMSRPELSRTRCGRGVTLPSRLDEYVQ